MNYDVELNNNFNPSSALSCIPDMATYINNPDQASLVKCC